MSGGTAQKQVPPRSDSRSPPGRFGRLNCSATPAPILTQGKSLQKKTSPVSSTELSKWSSEGQTHPQMACLKTKGHQIWWRDWSECPSLGWMHSVWGCPAVNETLDVSGEINSTKFHPKLLLSVSLVLKHHKNICLRDKHSGAQSDPIQRTCRDAMQTPRSKAPGHEGGIHTLLPVRWQRSPLHHHAPPQTHTHTARSHRMEDIQWLQQHRGNQKHDVEAPPATSDSCPCVVPQVGHSVSTQKMLQGQTATGDLSRLPASCTSDTQAHLLQPDEAQAADVRSALTPMLWKISSFANVPKNRPNKINLQPAHLDKETRSGSTRRSEHNSSCLQPPDVLSVCSRNVAATPRYCNGEPGPRVPVTPPRSHTSRSSSCCRLSSLRCM